MDNHDAILYADLDNYLDRLAEVDEGTALLEPLEELLPFVSYVAMILDENGIHDQRIDNAFKLENELQNEINHIRGQYDFA